MYKSSTETILLTKIQKIYQKVIDGNQLWLSALHIFPKFQIDPPGSLLLIGYAHMIQQLFYASYYIIAKFGNYCKQKCQGLLHTNDRKFNINLIHPLGFYSFDMSKWFVLFYWFVLTLSQQPDHGPKSGLGLPLCQVPN